MVRAMRLAKILSYLFYGPAWLTFLVMGVAAGGFAVCTFNLFELFSANFKLIAGYGWMAVVDGGLLQLFELIVWGYLGTACYVLFKGCLHGLLERVPHRAHRQDAPRSVSDGEPSAPL
jgi:hypothetical protein